MGSSLKSVLLCLLAFLCLRLVAHPIVNIEDRRVNYAGSGLYGSVALGANGNSGNKEKTDFDVEIDLRRISGDNQNMIIFAKSYGDNNHIKNENSLFAHYRYIRYFKEERAWEGFVQYQEDEFKRLNARSLFGGGRRWEFEPTPTTKSAYGAGAFYESENVIVEKGTDDGGDYDRLRLNFYGVFKIPLSRNAHLINTLYLQPQIDDLSNWRASNQMTVRIDVTNRIKLNTSVQFLYDAQPFDLVDSTDWSYKTRLSYEF